MNILFGIIMGFGCWAGCMLHIPFYKFVNAINNSGNEKIPYKFIKFMQKSYDIIFILALNIVSFIVQFFSISHDLQVVIFVVNVIFFITVFFDIIRNSYQKNYISILQNKILTEINIDDIFDIEEAKSLPKEYSNPGIYLLIKDTVYFSNDKIKIKLEPRKFGQKKSPLNFDEIEYIVEQLNKQEEPFSPKLKVKSFYKHSDIYPYSSFIVRDEVSPNKFRLKFLTFFVKIENILKPLLYTIYFLLGIVSFATISNSNWLYWFTIV